MILNRVYITSTFFNFHNLLNVYYKELKTGRAITGFDLIWSNGSTVASATQNQIKELKAIIDVVFDDVFKYVNLDNQEKRERSIELVRELEEYRQYIVEPICITKERADYLIVKATSIKIELEDMQQQDNAPAVPFFNWLEEREE